MDWAPRLGTGAKPRVPYGSDDHPSKDVTYSIDQENKGGKCMVASVLPVDVTKGVDNEKDSNSMG